MVEEKEEKKVTELTDEEIETVDGGSMGFFDGRMITSGITSAKNCPYYEAGSNFYNQQILAINRTCGACKHLMTDCGWHVCDARTESK